MTLQMQLKNLTIIKAQKKKKTLIYNNTKYLVKFPAPVIAKDNSVLFINNAYSEYIGSNIFKIIGFNAQETILGKYKYKNKEKVVCACKDFTDSENILYEFESLALSTNPDKKITTELKDIMEVIEENQMINGEEIKQKFWDMFVVDSLIGNTDRHNGNWGFIINKTTNKISFSPIYDCGSCLNPMLEDEDIKKLDNNEIKNFAINCYSCLKENNKKINYMTYIKTRKNEECNNAIKRIFKSINIINIKEFIDNIESISNIRKEFYKDIIEQRYKIIKEVYNLIK